MSVCERVCERESKSVLWKSSRERERERERESE